jgi:hypothetical protein
MTGRTHLVFVAITAALAFAPMNASSSPVVMSDDFLVGSAVQGVAKAARKTGAVLLAAEIDEARRILAENWFQAHRARQATAPP